MIIFLKIDGNGKGAAQIVTPETVYQGSDNVTDITVIAPFSAYTQMEIGFILPNGLYYLNTDSTYMPMTFVEQDFTTKVNVWKYSLPRSITETAGDVQVAINAAYMNGATQKQKANCTSFLCGFKVLPSVLPNLPSAPEPDIYAVIRQYLGELNGRTANVHNLVAGIEQTATNAFRPVELDGSKQSDIVLWDKEHPAPMPVGAASVIEIPGTSDAWKNVATHTYTATILASQHGQMRDGVSAGALRVSVAEYEDGYYDLSGFSIKIYPNGDIAITTSQEPVPSITVSVWNGKGIGESEISDIKVQYATSSDGKNPPDSGWVDEVPTVAQGTYLWTRTVITYKNDLTSTSYSVGYQGKDYVFEGFPDGKTIIGENAQANGSNATAIGISTAANGESSVAIGNGSVARTRNSYAIGTRAVAGNTGDPNETAQAWGYEATAEGVRCIAIGAESFTKGNSYDSVALGKGIKMFNAAGGSVGIGSDVTVGTEGGDQIQCAIAMGWGSQAKASNTIALGRDAIADAEGDIVIGAISKYNKAFINVNSMVYMPSAHITPPSENTRAKVEIVSSGNVPSELWLGTDGKNKIAFTARQDESPAQFGMWDVVNGRWVFEYTNRFQLRVPLYDKYGGEVYSSKKPPPVASLTQSGTVKPYSVISKPTIQPITAASDRYYHVQMSSDGDMFVNVPWEKGSGGGDNETVTFQSGTPISNYISIPMPNCVITISDIRTNNNNLSGGNYEATDAYLEITDSSSDSYNIQSGGWINITVSRGLVMEIVIYNSSGTITQTLTQNYNFGDITLSNLKIGESYDSYYCQAIVSIKSN